jgi:hypothetical protein
MSFAQDITSDISSIESPAENPRLWFSAGAENPMVTERRRNRVRLMDDGDNPDDLLQKKYGESIELADELLRDEYVPLQVKSEASPSVEPSREDTRLAVLQERKRIALRLCEAMLDILLE